MTATQFAQLVGLISLTEIEKVLYLAYYYLAHEGQTEFDIPDVVKWFSELNLPSPNRSRLAANLKKSTAFIKGADDKKKFRLHAREIDALSGAYPNIGDKSEEVVSGDSILPSSLTVGTRGYIEAIAKQINAAYEHNLFDAAAVLMRRLVEILLILSYQHLGIDSAIKNRAGEYVMLEQIIDNAQGKATLNLSRNSRSVLGVFRTLGNFSAHKIFYTAKRSDIKNVAIEFRALIEELLYKSGIKI